MLFAIKNLLAERKEMSLTDLARHFYVSEPVMQSMMAQWIRKGRADKVELINHCGSQCGSCDQSRELTTVYRWKPVPQKSIFIKSDSH